MPHIYQRALVWLDLGHFLPPESQKLFDLDVVDLVNIYVVCLALAKQLPYFEGTLAVAKSIAVCLCHLLFLGYGLLLRHLDLAQPLLLQSRKFWVVDWPRRAVFTVVPVSNISIRAHDRIETLSLRWFRFDYILVVFNLGSYLLLLVLSNLLLRFA